MKRVPILLLLLVVPSAVWGQAPVAAAPEISLSGNGANSVALYQGWPLIISLNILNSTRFQGANASPLVISPQGAAWTDVIQFNAVSSSGASFQWPLKLVGSPASPSLTLQRSSYVRAIWQMSATDTLTLPSDTYQLTATLQVSNSTGWNGVATSSPVAVQIGAEPSLTQEQQFEKALTLSQYQTNSGNLDGALTTMMQYLKANPGDSGALSAAANLAELQGLPGLGFFLARDAFNAYYQANPTPVEAPSNLLSMYQRLFTYMTTPNSSAVPTSTTVSNASAGYSPADQSVSLSAMISSSNASINEGTVVFKVLGVGNAVSVTPVQSSATANFTIPGGTPVGNYAIEVSYSGTSSFGPSSASSLLTIAAVPLTIVANNATREYSQPNPLFTVSYSGLPAGSPPPALAGTLMCTTTATAGSPAGSYPITCSGLSSTNYVITFVPGTLTVTPDCLTVTAGGATRQYGQANPALNSVTYSGFVNGDTPAALGGTLLCMTSATPMSSVGSYAITCSGLTSQNYSITFVPGTLMIVAAPLAIAANNASRAYGASNPALTGMISGLQNADPISATFTTAATPASPVGSYAITPVVGGAPSVLANYNTSLVPGMLMVVPETTSLTVAFSPPSIGIGQSTTATVTLTAPDMVIPIDPNVLANMTLTSPVVSDVLSNNGVCTPVPSTGPGVASCTITVTSIEPNGRTLKASFPGSADLTASSGSGALMVTAALQGQRACIRSDFRNVAVGGGNTIWFNSIFKVRDVTKQLVHVSFYQGTVQFQYTDATGKVLTVNQALPDAQITIDPSAAAASTAFDTVNNVWNTTIPWDLDDNAFLTGLPWTVPSAGLPGDVEPVTVCGTFASDVANIYIGWRWAAAVYSSFGSDNNTLGVKPMDTDHDNHGTNRDRVGTPENYKQFVIPGARGKGAENYTGSYSGSNAIE
jgi:MBG domain (YGX type)/Bacterial Ig-like domain (group 3)